MSERIVASRENGIVEIHAMLRISLYAKMGSLVLTHPDNFNEPDETCAASYCIKAKPVIPSLLAPTGSEPRLSLITAPGKGYSRHEFPVYTENEYPND